MTKLHRELSLPLRRCSEQCGKPKHAIQAAVGINSKVLRAILGIVDDGVAFVQQPDDVTLEFVGGGDGGFHEWFEDLRFCFDEAFAECLLRGDFECHL